MATQYRFPEITDEQARSMLSLEGLCLYHASSINFPLAIVQISTKRQILVIHSSTISANEHTHAIDCWRPVSRPLTHEECGSLRQWIKTKKEAK